MSYLSIFIIILSIFLLMAIVSRLQTMWTKYCIDNEHIKQERAKTAEAEARKAMAEHDLSDHVIQNDSGKRLRSFD